MERIGGDRICDSALAAASSMAGYLSNGLRHVDTHAPANKALKSAGLTQSGVERLAAHERSESRERDDHDDHRRGDQPEHAANPALLEHVGHDETRKHRADPAHRIDQASGPRAHGGWEH